MSKGHKTEKNVEGVTVHNQSLVILLFVPSFVKLSQSYRVDTISMPQIKKGNNSAKTVSGVTSFYLCKWLVMLYIFTKFREIISNGIKVMEWTQFLY